MLTFLFFFFNTVFCKILFIKTKSSKHIYSIRKIPVALLKMELYAKVKELNSKGEYFWD